MSYQDPSSGLGQEAFGHEVSYVDGILKMFNQVPLVSNLARSLVQSVGVSPEVEEFMVPFVTILFLIGGFKLIRFIIRSGIHLGMVFTMFNVKGVGATGRFSTFWEVFQNYTISTPISFVLSAYCLGFIAAYSALFLFHHMSQTEIRPWEKIGILFISMLLGAIFHYFRGQKYADIRKQTQPYPLGLYKGFMRIYLTGGRRDSLIRGEKFEDRENHVLLIGRTGSGKTSGYFVPGILEDSFNNCSAIVIEAKASAQEDMFSMIAPVWAAQGKKVILFDPWSDESKGVGFNPFLDLKASFNDVTARDLIELVVDAIYSTYATERGATTGDAAFHADKEIRLLKGLLNIALFKPKGQRNLAAVAEVVSGTLDSVRQYINSVVNFEDNSASDEAAEIRKHLMWFLSPENGREDLKVETLSGLAGKLHVFTHPRVRPFLIKDELDLDIIFKEPCLFVIKSPLNVPGASTMASIIIRLLMKKVPEKLSYGAGKDFKVFFYLDELPALSIPKFDQFCKTARSSGTGIIASVQGETDIAEVTKPRLGIASVHDLAANFKTHILLAGNSHTTAKYYSDSFGTTEFKTRKLMRSTQNPVDFNAFAEKKEVPLVNPDMISKMDSGKAIIVDANMRPFWAQSIPYFKSPRYIKIIEDASHKEFIIYKKPCEDFAYDAPIAPAPCSGTKSSKKKGLAEDPFTISGSPGIADTVDMRIIETHGPNDSRDDDALSVIGWSEDHHGH